MNKEKKQLAVMGVLLVLVLGIGAFQFMGGTPEAPPPAGLTKEEERVAAEQKKQEEEAKTAIKNPEFANSLPQRDPFQVAGFALTAKVEETPPTPAPIPDPKPEKSKIRRPKLNPLSGELPGLNSGPETLVPAEPPKPKFEFSLIGIVTGSEPAAVFTDPSGNQRMVEPGQSLGSNAQVLSISKSTVKVRFINETLVLKVGGNSHAK